MPGGSGRRRSRIYRQLPRGPSLHRGTIPGPGHTPGSIGLHSESESALFLGDILNNERGIRTPPWNVNHSHRLALQAPKRLEALSYERAYFGHGPAILTGADQCVRAFLRRRMTSPALTA